MPVAISLLVEELANDDQFCGSTTSGVLGENT